MKAKAVALMLLIGFVVSGTVMIEINLARPVAIQANGSANFFSFVPVGNGTTTGPLGDPIDTPGMPT
jgi:predicted cation transporter